MSLDVKKSPQTRWVKPELIVLTRSKPEENILDSCKVFDQPGSSSDIYQACISEMMGDCGLNCTELGAS